MIQKLRTLAADERGTSLIEMALATPMFAALLMGMVDLSRAYSEKLQLEQASEEQKRAIIEKIFRGAHSLKGAARAVSLADVERLCHALESLFGSWKSNRVTPASFDLVHEALDVLAELLSSPAPSPPLTARLDELTQLLDRPAEAGRYVKTQNREPAVPLAAGTIRTACGESHSNSRSNCTRTSIRASAALA